jgi:hypothetical protein
MSLEERAADLDRIDHSAVMQPPLYDSAVLGAAVKSSRSLASERASLRSALSRGKAEEQERRLMQQQDAQASSLEEELVAARAAVGMDANVNAGSGTRRSTRIVGPSGLPPLMELTEVQRELLAQVEQPEPAHRMASFEPLPERLARWLEEHGGGGGGGGGGSSGEPSITPAELDSRLHTLAQQYRDSRARAGEDVVRSRRIHAHLHDMSLKLASVARLADLENLAENQRALRAQDPTLPPFDPARHFYDLSTLDFDSLADVKHVHAANLVPLSSVAVSGGDDATMLSGWWRTQLAELDEDLGEKRRRDAAVLAELERGGGGADDGYAALGADGQRALEVQRAGALDFDRLNGRSNTAGAGAAEGGLQLASNFRANESELEADLLQANKDKQQPARLTREQLLARTQGRSYPSVSRGGDVQLPEGQRMLRPAASQTHIGATAAASAVPAASASAVPSASAVDDDDPFAELSARQPARRHL